MHPESVEYSEGLIFSATLASYILVDVICCKYCLSLLNFGTVYSMIAFNGIVQNVPCGIDIDRFIHRT